MRPPGTTEASPVQVVSCERVEAGARATLFRVTLALRGAPPDEIAGAELVAVDGARTHRCAALPAPLPVGAATVTLGFAVPRTATALGLVLAGRSFALTEPDNAREAERRLRVVQARLDASRGICAVVAGERDEALRAAAEAQLECDEAARAAAVAASQLYGAARAAAEAEADRSAALRAAAVAELARAEAVRAAARAEAAAHDASARADALAKRPPVGSARPEPAAPGPRRGSARPEPAAPGPRRGSARPEPAAPGPRRGSRQTATAAAPRQGSRRAAAGACALGSAALLVTILAWPARGGDGDRRVGAVAAARASAADAPRPVPPAVDPLAARLNIPAAYLKLYRRAAARYGLDWTRLAAVGAIESGHGQDPVTGIVAGANIRGASGPAQFLAGTWERFGLDGNGDGDRNPYDPADAIFAMASYLRASGAPQDWRGALRAYNHSDAYVTSVETLAASLRGEAT
jgi:hypothetical protein